MMIKDYYLVVITLLLIGGKNQGGTVRYGGRLISYLTMVSEEERFAHLCLEVGEKVV